MSIGSIVTGAIKQTPPNALQQASDELLGAVSKQVKPELSDAQYATQELNFIRNKGTLNRDGSLRSPTQEGPISIPSFRKYKAKNDVRGLADAIRNVRSHKFNTSGGGIGAGILEEALGKPAWKHSGREVKVVNMSPTEYLAKSAKGHGIEYEELLKQLAQGDRLDNVVDGMSEGKQFAAPYLDYRNGNFSQEGQHRAYAAAMLGQDKIPVAVIWNDVKKTKPDNSAAMAEARARADRFDEERGDKTLRDMMNEILGRKDTPMTDEIAEMGKSRKQENAERLARRDEQGFTEETFFHSTTAKEDFDEFKPFSHFGTSQAAEDRFKVTRGAPGPNSSKKPRTLPVNIKWNKPLMIRDNGLSNANMHASAVVESLEAIEEGSVSANWIKEFRGLTSEVARYKSLSKMLEDKGFDALTYKNRAEDRGSISIIPLSNQQIRGKFAAHKDPSSGKIMAGTAAAAVGLSQGGEAEAGTNTVGTDSVDWGFIEDREGFETKMYVPNPDGSQSGPTVGTGIDLGAWGEDDLKSLGVDKALIEKLKPYFGKKGRAAADYVDQNPIELTEEEARDLSTRVKTKILDRLKTKFDKDSNVAFDDLTPEQQTVVASVYFQYGNKVTGHNFWNQITSGDWGAAKKNLENYGDDYGTRRRKEAKLL
jgi:hypothetical protein